MTGQTAAHEEREYRRERETLARYREEGGGPCTCGGAPVAQAGRFGPVVRCCECDAILAEYDAD